MEELLQNGAFYYKTLRTCEILNEQEKRILKYVRIILTENN